MMKLAIVFAILLAGCASADQKAAAADTAYGADQIECVKAATTRAQADACREAKREMWDAGLDAAKDGAK